MTTSTFIDTSNPYPDYTTKYNVNMHLGARLASFNTYDEAAQWAEANGYCVISGSMGWNRGGNPPCPEAYIIDDVPDVPIVLPHDPLIDPLDDKKGIDPKLIIIAVIALILLLRS